MPDSPESSFIPKRNPVKQVRSAMSRQMYVFSIVSSALLIAALLSAAGVFVYKEYTERVLASSARELSDAAVVFNERDMRRVVALDERLKAAQRLTNRSVSVRSVLELLETGTINTFQINDLSLSRVGDGPLTLKANFTTDSFDSVLFQRSVYEGGRFASVDLKEVEIKRDEQTVILSAELTVDGEAVPYTPTPAMLPGDGPRGVVPTVPIEPPPAN
jgi:hypothetical protein